MNVYRVDENSNKYEDVGREIDVGLMSSAYILLDLEGNKLDLSRRFDSITLLLY
jgi:hypothetical protein